MAGRHRVVMKRTEAGVELRRSINGWRAWIDGWAWRFARTSGGRWACRVWGALEDYPSTFKTLAEAVRWASKRTREHLAWSPSRAAIEIARKRVKRRGMVLGLSIDARPTACTPIDEDGWLVQVWMRVAPEEIDEARAKRGGQTLEEAHRA